MEQQTVERAATRTTLQLGAVNTAIGLYKTTRDPSQSRKWEKPPVEDEDGDAKGDPLAGSAAKASGGEGKSKGKKVSGGSKATEVEVEKPQKGIYKPDGAFVNLTEQIESIAEQTTLDRLEVVSFIRRERVPRDRILGSYYVGAGKAKKGEYPPTKVIARLYRALKLRERGAVVRWGKRSRSSVGVMVPHPSGALLVLEMAYGENVLLPSPDCLAHQHIEISDEQVERMATLVDAMAEGRASLDGIRDRRAELEEELIVRAEHGELDDFEATTYEVDSEVDELGKLIEDSLVAA